MFYRPKDGHGLPHNPFNAIVVPRPIGWISTRSKGGIDNLAPYSFFNATAYTPPQVMFAATGTKDDRAHGKDSMANIQDTGVFCVNIVATRQMDEMNASSRTDPKDTDEFALAHIDRQECTEINCARVKGSPAALECTLTQIIQQKGDENYIILGEVVGIHLAGRCLTNGLFDIEKVKPLARLGYRDYASIETGFTLARPDDN